MELNPSEHHEQWGEGNPQKIKVLMYHRVVNAVNVSYAYPGMCISTQEFHNQMSMLERWGFTSITFEDYRLFLRGELNLPKKPVILTFDDAYLDFHENAFPVLEEFGMRSVVFCVADKKLSANFWDKSNGLPLAPLMNEQQLLELHAAGHEIGSHSLTHPILPRLVREKAWDEIYRSRMMLEILLNAPVKTFAFPYGNLNDATKKMVQDAGYETACATFSGPPKFASDPFEIRRTLIQGNLSPLHFALMLFTPYEYVGWLRWKLKKLFRGGGAASAKPPASPGISSHEPAHDPAAH
ncbi:MAG TPA: polysaccharide deacetylase family protein [Bacteroidota bacterium]|nr:polysaccharide deacetylase family protein [Bacteroidota bacterium]